MFSQLARTLSLGLVVSFPSAALAQAEPEREHASVYVFRDGGMRAPRGEALLGKLAGNADVFVDETPVARLTRLSYAHLRVDPGWHLLWGKSDPEWFNFKAGYTYLLHMVEGQGQNGQAAWSLDAPWNIESRAEKAQLERIEPTPESLEPLRRDLGQYPRVLKRAGEAPATDEVELEKVVYFERSASDPQATDPPPRRQGGRLAVTESGVLYESAEARLEVAKADIQAFGSGRHWCGIRYVRDGVARIAIFDAPNLPDHNRVMLAIVNHLTHDRLRPSLRDEPSVARLREPLEITRPFPVAVAQELVEQGPRVEPGVMPVVEYEPHGVAADGLDSRDSDFLLAGHEHALAGRVALDLGRR
jgi:hypothetical protein